MGNSFQYLGEKCSCFEEFDTTRYDGVNIIYAYVALRKILGGLNRGQIFNIANYLPNHWSVILELDNGKYVCTQLDTTGKIDLRVRNSLREASMETWGRDFLVRLSKYGSCKYNYNKFLDSLKGGHWYIILVNDCQNFARNVIRELTGKYVGVFPIEDGPTFKKQENYRNYNYDDRNRDHPICNIF